MCSLFSFKKSAAEVQSLFQSLQIPLFPPRDYVTPASPIAIVRHGASQGREMALVRWGFVPSWSKEMQAGRPLLNARSETVYEKPTFRNAIRRRRCLIPADGFYEWQKLDARTQFRCQLCGHRGADVDARRALGHYG